ncbi:MAG: hypothetical protein ABL934_16855 [Lysobacteraceae bacterium]
MPLVFLLIPFSVFASEPISLNEPFGGDCTLAYRIFDAVHKKGEARHRLSERSTLFLSDLCDLNERISIGADGQSIILDRNGGRLRKGLSGSTLSYRGHGYVLVLKIGATIESFYDPDTECTESWHSIAATIRNGRRRKQVEGTLTGGCP